MKKLFVIIALIVFPLLSMAQERKVQNRPYIDFRRLHYGFFFGLLCSLPYFFVGGWQMSFSFWLSGLYYDFLHGVSNAVMTFVLHKPIYKLLKKLHERDFGKGE